MTMKVSVIIVAYKNGKVLKDSLDSLNRYNDLGSELEVIVVDNSPDGERVAASVQDSFCPDACYIPADNKGFGAGNNRGAKVASGEILCFMNPDILYIEPVFGKVWQKFQEDPLLMLAGGNCFRRIYPRGSPFIMIIAIPFGFGRWTRCRTNGIALFRNGCTPPERTCLCGGKPFCRGDV